MAQGDIEAKTLVRCVRVLVCCRLTMQRSPLTTSLSSVE